jgi:hypothetical protein
MIGTCGKSSRFRQATAASTASELVKSAFDRRGVRKIETPDFDLKSSVCGTNLPVRVIFANYHCPYWHQ